MATKAHERMLEYTTSSVEKVRRMARCLLSPYRTFESMVRGWHIALDIPVNEKPTEISVENAAARLQLTFDEFKELISHSGFRLTSKETGEDLSNQIVIAPVPRGKQNLVGIGDSLCDIMVTCLGNAAVHGIRLEPLFDEAMYSNGTKLSIDGEARTNRCVSKLTDKTHDCSASDAQCVLLSPDEPDGKILKTASFVGPDMQTLLEQQCQEEDSQPSLGLPEPEEESV